MYYWRARVPAPLGGRDDAGRLSLSLRFSDHRKAGYVARRLNTLLHDLRLRPNAKMTTKEQLAALFRAEIDRMHEHLDDLPVMSRRMGSADDVGQLDADLEVGWAYRLLQLFGNRKPLAFDGDCPGLALLLRNGIPGAHVGNIAATFTSEQRGMQNGVFEDQTKARMAGFDIPDTVLNRERALTEIFRAKADVLLDIGERYPLVDRDKSQFTRTGNQSKSEVQDGEIEAGALADPTLSNRAGSEVAPVGLPVVPDVPPASAAVADAPENDAAPTEAWAPPSGPELSVGIGTTADAPASKPTDPGESVAEQAAADEPAQASSSGGRVLPVADFMAACEKLIANKGEEWTADSAHDARVLVKTFQGILDEHGVNHSGEIEQFHVAALRQHFNEIPPRYGQSARLRVLSPKELREVAARLAEMAKEAEKPAPKFGLSGATIRRHLGNLDQFLHHVRSSGYDVEDWTFKGLRPKKKDKALIRHQQVKPPPEQVRPLFNLPIYTGCQDAKNQHLPGELVFHSSLYFLPMGFAYLGPRRHELAGLAPDDVAETRNGWAIHIRANENRRIKNVQSDRTLPVPDEMLRLNFLDYVDAIRALGYRQLFPELYSPFLEDQDPG